MPAPNAQPAAISAAAPPAADPRTTRIAASEISLLILIIAAVAVAQAFPFKPIKYGLIGLFVFIMIAQTMRRPAIGLAMLIFAVPVMDIVPPGLLGVPALNAETIMVLFGLFIWSRANQLYGRDPVGTQLGKVVGVYALLIVVSAFNSWMTWKGSLFDILGAAKNHISFMVFLPIAFHTLRDKRDQGVLVGAISITIVLNSFQAINHSWMAFLSGSLERHRAMAILALQPNTLGAALAMYLPLFAVFSSNKISTRAAQLWFVFCTAVTAFALLLTLSRGSWMGLAAALIAVGLFRDRKILVFILLAAATHTFWAPQEAVDRVSETTQFNEDLAADDQMFEGSAQMRVEQYKSLGTMMAPRPILGWGYRSYPKVFEQLGTLKRNKGAHSSYCQLGTEGGVVGLAALVAVLGAMMWTGWRGARVTTDPFHRWIGVAVMAGALSMAVSMITGARFEPQKIFAFFWVLAGIVERETVLALLARPGAALVTVGNRPEEAR